MKRLLTTITLVVGTVIPPAACSSTKEPQRQTAEIRVVTAETVCWSGDINGGDARGCGPKTFPVLADFENISAIITKRDADSFFLTLEIWKNGELVDSAITSVSKGSVSVRIDD